MRVLVAVLGGRTMEKVTDAIAVAGVGTIFFPELWSWMQSFSEVAALLMPPMGVAWLAVQIWAKVIAPRKKEADE